MVDKLIGECAENVEEAKLAEITSVELHSTENENKNKCSCCTLYIVLFSIVSTISIGIATYLFTAHTWVVIKKMFLNIIMSIKQQIIYINGKYKTN